ncbi:MAG: HTH-type transcriptional regulator / antitoxin HigA [Blastocatellia bacterium]|jgi:addiction module HigA family antidote|nr:HTH-type transcriptional regulator / antitoxin HigA [Blastocatellia bacterium]
MDKQANLRYEPDTVPHPGEFLVEYLESNRWTQREVARRTGITTKTVSEICNGKAPITPPTSLALERLFQRPAHFWLNLQRQFDEAEARKRESANRNEWEAWAAKFPVKEMKKRGWLTAPDKSTVEQLLSFFGVSSPNSWNAVWQATNVSYRQTLRFKTSNEAVSAWARQAEIDANYLKLTFNDFSEERLRSSLEELRGLTRKKAEVFVPLVQQLCADAGVAVVWVRELPQTGISGCARWLSDKRALIAMTLRYKTDDQIWLTFFHEVAHLLLHKKSLCFIVDNAAKDLGDKIVDPEMRKDEEEATRFAEDTLIPPNQLFPFIKGQDFSQEAIEAFAEQVNVGPGIVVGRLQREGVLAYFQGTRLKQQFAWGDDA